MSPTKSQKIGRKFAGCGKSPSIFQMADGDGERIAVESRSRASRLRFAGPFNTDIWAIMFIMHALDLLHHN